MARLGDIYHLGPHHLACGDATDAALLRRLMSGGAKPRLGRRVVSGVGNCSLARMVLTDEPYNVHIAGNVTGGRASRVRDGLGRNERRRISSPSTKPGWPLLCPISSTAALLATFIDWRGYSIVDAAAVNLGLAPAQSGRLVEDERRHGQPLSLPARAPAAVQEGRRAARQQRQARQARPLAVECLDLPRRLLARLRRPPRLGRTTRPSSRPRCSKTRCST